MSDIVIVGAGPAGATAAVELAGLGIPTTLIDDNPHAGGQIFRRAADGAAPGIGADARGEALRSEIDRHRHLVDHRSGHEVLALFAGPRVWAAGPGQAGYELRPRHLVLATGALEVSVPVPGWTLPGVYTLGGLQILAKSAAIVPAGRVVLGGAGPLLYLVAAQLVEAGVDVAAVIDAAAVPTPRQLLGMARAPGLLARGIGYEAALRRRRVKILRRAAIVEVAGSGRAAEVVVAMLGGDWRPRRRGRLRLRADVVALSYGLRANTELTQLLGCAHAHDPVAGGWRVTRDAHFMTSVEGVYVIGDGAGIGGVDTALAEGVLLARHLSRRLGVTDRAALDARADEAARRLRRLAAFRRALTAWSGLRPGIFSAADGTTIVCRCEDVSGAELDAALAAGLAQPRGLKMRTRAGMGLCQGRTCTPAILQRIAQQTGTSVGDVPLPTVRAPVRPAPAATLAAFAPTR